MNDRKIKILNIDDVLPNRFQPRIQFDEKAINELAESIKVHGVIQPIVVRKISDKYEIIAGERRYKASVLAGSETIPAIITNFDDKESAEIALIENVQRQNLTPIEEAISYKKILDMGYLSQVELGEKLGKNQSTIANKLRLLNLEEEVQEALMNNKISERHARSLLRLDNSKQVDMLERIINERLTVRKLDEEIEKVLNNYDDKEIERVDNVNNDILKEMGIPTSPIVEEPVIEENKIEEKDESSLDNLTFNLPKIEDITPVTSLTGDTISSPIIEQPEFTNENTNSEILSFESTPIENNEIEEILTEIQEPVVENIVNIQNENINPGFMDVDKIASTAEDVYKAPAPLADIDKLMDTSNNPKIEEPISPFQPVENASIMKEESSSFGMPGGGKFFTMFAREEDTNPDYVKDIESETVNMDFSEPKIEPTFSFESPSLNEIKSEENVIEPVSSMSQVDPNRVFTMSQEPPVVEDNKMDFTQTFKPFSLNDDQTFSKEEPTLEPEPISHVQKVEPITFDDMGEINVKIPEKQKLATTDLKTVINTIRECAATIERFGFTIDTEEIDFEDSYQVIFKIDKN